MKRKGSITLFFALLLTCLFSCFFAFLEAARVSGLKANVQMCTMQAKDGLLASYSRPLWEEYHLLFWESDGEDFPQLSEAGNLQKEIVEGNWELCETAGKNFYVFPVHLSQVQVQSYQLATDDGGAPFRKQAAEMMQESITEDAAAALLKVLTGAADSRSEVQTAEQEKAALDVLEALNQKKDDFGEQSSAVQETGTNPESVKSNEQLPAENPIQWMKEVKQSGVFALLMPQEEISQKKADFSSGVSRRKLREGTISDTEKITASDKLLFRLYLTKYFSDMTEKSTEHALDYEMEYLIGGKESDKDNLTAVVNRLLLVREAANMTYLETNPQKQQEALAVAMVLTTAVGQPELAEVVKHGVMIAWAYAESLSDVRILLAGGKVSLIKTDAQWHTQLTQLAASITENGGEQQENGLSYEGYLQVLLWTMPDRTLSERAMTLMEKNTGVCMDCMVCRMNCTYEYEASALFWNFVRLGDHSISGYRFRDEAALDYFKDR